MYLLTLSLLPAFVSATSILLQANNLDSRLANIHLSPRSGEVDVAYGSCDNFTALHHIIKRSVNSSSSRLVWLIPDDVPLDGCLTAWENGQLVGKSEGLSFLKKRNILPPIPMDNSTGIDTRGPWFDGVMHLKDRPISEVDEKTAKKKSISLPPDVQCVPFIDGCGRNWDCRRRSSRIDDCSRFGFFCDIGSYALIRPAASANSRFQELGDSRIVKSSRRKNKDCVSGG